MNEKLEDFLKHEIKSQTYNFDSQISEDESAKIIRGILSVAITPSEIDLALDIVLSRYTPEFKDIPLDGYHCHSQGGMDIPASYDRCISLAQNKSELYNLLCKKMFPEKPSREIASSLPEPEGYRDEHGMMR